MMKKSLIVLAASLMTCSFQMKAETAQDILNKFHRKVYTKEIAIQHLKGVDIPSNLYTPLKRAGLISPEENSPTSSTSSNRSNTNTSGSTSNNSRSTNNNSRSTNNNSRSTNNTSGSTNNNKPGMRHQVGSSVNSAVQEVREAYDGFVQEARRTNNEDVVNRVVKEFEDVNNDRGRSDLNR